MVKMKLLYSGSHPEPEVKAGQDVSGHSGKKHVLLLLLCFTWWKVICQEGYREEVSIILSGVSRWWCCPVHTVPIYRRSSMGTQKTF